LSVLFGALSYLAIPTFAGFLAARRTGKDLSGVISGSTVGAVSFLLIILVVAVVAPSSFAAIPHSRCTPNCGHLLLIPPEWILTALFFGTVIMNGFGLVPAILGGWLGGVLGAKRAGVRASEGRPSE
jgi:hypothetical protein